MRKKKAARVAQSRAAPDPSEDRSNYFLLSMVGQFKPFFEILHRQSLGGFFAAIV
jgi:hypothetical protein